MKHPRAALAAVASLLIATTIIATAFADDRRAGAHGRDRVEADVHSEAAAAVDATALVHWIADAVGILNVPPVIEGGVPNATATYRGGQPVILYNREFLQQVIDDTDTDWAAIAVLAHELGHHVNFHTAGGGDAWTMELQADHFSGRVLARLGATLAETQSAVEALAKIYGEDGNPSHPPIAKRLSVIESAWRSEHGKVATAAPPPSTTATASVGASRPTPRALAAIQPLPSRFELAPRKAGGLAVELEVVVDGETVGTLDNRGTSRELTMKLTPGPHSWWIQGTAYEAGGEGEWFPVGIWRGGGDLHVSPATQDFTVRGDSSGRVILQPR